MKQRITKLLLCLFLGMTILLLPKDDVRAEQNANQSGLTGTFDSTSQQYISNTLVSAINQEVNQQDKEWRKYLNDEFLAQNQFDWIVTNQTVSKWSGATANKVGTPRTDALAYPEANTNGEYEIFYPEQLVYALVNSNIVTKIKLMNDFDMQGFEHEWNYNIYLSDFTFLGNGHTIYNIGSSRSFITEVKNSTIDQVTFSNAKLVSKDNSVTNLGIIGEFASSGTSTINLVRIQNSLFFSSCAIYGGGTTSYVAPLGKLHHVNANQIATENNIIYAVKAHAGGTFGVTSNSIIDNSYSVDSTVIAGGNHSGGFISCSDAGNTVSNSFTNNAVYGNKQTGVFIGALFDNYSATVHEDTFINCFSSGTVEGQDQLGGFVGIIDAQYDNTTKFSFINCYSTSIVGMRNGGKNLGGFVGYIDNNHRQTYIFENCFAAGEVGSIDTNLEEARTDYTTVGGFVGTPGDVSKLNFINCYYDKQTTGMREWESGNSLDFTGNGDVGLRDIKGLKGVLTSDSNKFGSGLAAQPTFGVADSNTTTGFTGFTGDYLIDQTIIGNANWIYDGGNTDASLHNCMYPQLNVFYNSNDAFVRAYSYASVATVHEQVWDNAADNTALPNKTYDTVRDLTQRFTLTSYVDNAKDTNIGISWSKTDESTSIYGEQKQVIGSFNLSDNAKYNRQYWTADNFAPGIEWVKVEFRITEDNKTVVGSRRLRIIPTSNITAGKDQIDLTDERTYDHAKDMYMAYSTGKRMANNALDITTGVYPDTLPFEAGDPRISIQHVDSAVEAQFAQDANRFTVSSEHLTGVSNGTSAPTTNLVNVYLYNVVDFQEIPGSDDAKIIYGTKEDALLSPAVLNGDKGAERKKTADLWAEKLNGKAAFTKEDVGRYLIEYEWIMPDGRFMRDSKMIMIQEKTHDVSIQVRNSSDQTLNNSTMKLSLDAYQYGDSLPIPTFTNTASNQKTVVNHASPVNIAFQAKHANVSVDKIVFEFKLGDISSSTSIQTVEIANVTVNQEFEVPITYYYSSYEDNHNYYAKKVTTIKKYTLKQDASGYYYLTLNHEFQDAATNVQRFDTECDVKATIYVSDALVQDTGKAIISTTTLKDGKPVYLGETFEYQILDDQGNEVKRISTSTDEDHQQEVILPIGTYTIKQLNDQGYRLDSVNADGTLLDEPYQFQVVTDGVIHLNFQNVRNTDDMGMLIFENTTFENGKLIYSNQEFTYHIYDQDGNVVETFTTTSLKGNQKQILLAPGVYTIKQAKIDWFSLESMRIDSQVITKGPYTFQIQKDDSMSIVAKNIREVKEIKPITPDTRDTTPGKHIYFVLMIASCLLMICTKMKWMMEGMKKR